MRPLAPRASRLPSWAAIALLASACDRAALTAPPAAVVAEPPATRLALDVARPSADLGSADHAPSSSADTLGAPWRDGCPPTVDGRCAGWIDPAVAPVRIVAVRAGAVGADVPGRVRLTLTLAVENRAHVALAAAMGSANGPTLVLLGAEAPPHAGGVTTTGEGNTLLVSLPSTGPVTPSVGWAEPRRLLAPAQGTAPCREADGDCRRWLDLGAPVAPHATVAAASTVAFDVAPTVRVVAVRVAVLARAAHATRSGSADAGRAPAADAAHVLRAARVPEVRAARRWGARDRVRG